MRRALSCMVLVVGCCCPQPVAPSRIDDTESAQELASGLDACARAAKRLEALKCPEARPDFADVCRDLTRQGVPLCPTKLARIAACSEVKSICR